eukprot:TRINITY_DN76673_c0_g1_i2.p1 TRINITY_DN76673_c0_g1~~TRINITY_DN76673_c0_g1_i2.p1  ORF type:complete len:293 (+),score=13.78 TRINITY_DN76673_c0_g1_i2:65-880(+)
MYHGMNVTVRATFIAVDDGSRERTFSHRRRHSDPLLDAWRTGSTVSGFCRSQPWIPLTSPFEDGCLETSEEDRHDACHDAGLNEHTFGTRETPLEFMKGNGGISDHCMLGGIHGGKDNAPSDGRGNTISAAVLNAPSLCTTNLRICRSPEWLQVAPAVLQGYDEIALLVKSTQQLTRRGGFFSENLSSRCHVFTDSEEQTPPMKHQMQPRVTSVTGSTCNGFRVRKKVARAQVAKTRMTPPFCYNCGNARKSYFRFCEYCGTCFKASFVAS